jgi:hypothetical protein
VLRRLYVGRQLQHYCTLPQHRAGVQDRKARPVTNASAQQHATIVLYTASHILEHYGESMCMGLMLPGHSILPALGQHVVSLPSAPVRKPSHRQTLRNGDYAARFCRLIVFRGRCSSSSKR